MHDFFIHSHEWAARKGMFPRFELLSHVQAEQLTFEKWLIFEINHFSKISCLVQNQLNLEKWLNLKSKPFSKV